MTPDQIDAAIRAIEKWRRWCCEQDVDADETLIDPAERAIYLAGLAAGRASMREDAATVCEAIGLTGKPDTRDSWTGNCAAAIRALP